MKAPGRIVVGVDGSTNSLDALAWAVGQAALTGAGVQAVIAWDYPTLSGVDPDDAHVDWRTKARESINARLARVMGTDSVNVSLVVVAGTRPRSCSTHPSAQSCSSSGSAVMAASPRVRPTQSGSTLSPTLRAPSW